jgi:hypothetical protein
LRPERPQLIPRVPFIQRFAILLAKAAVFRLKIFFPMMFRLRADVLAHWINMDWAHTEFSVPGLPREVGVAFVLFLIQPDDEDLICSTIYAGAWFFDWAKRICMWSETEFISMS